MLGMSKSKRNTGKQAFWRRAIGGHRRSGLGVRAYCRREGLSEASFYWWRRRLVERVAAVMGAAPAAFVEVTSATRPAPAVAPAVESSLEVRLPGGAIVCVQAGFDAALLRQVVEALS
jgi:hypothetical protein